MILLTRLAAPLWLIWLAVVQYFGGLERVPGWLDQTAGRAGLEPETVLRAMIGFELACACVMLLAGRIARAVAIAALIVICFVAFAEIGAVGLSIDGLGSMLALLVSVPLLALIGLKPAPLPTPSTPGLAPWLSAVTGAAACLVVAAFIPLRNMSSRPTINDGLPPLDADASTIPAPAADVLPGERVRSVAMTELPPQDYFEPDAQLGRPASEISWLKYLPEDVPSRLANGRRFIVFYTPESPLCHDLFTQHLPAIDPGSIIAIRVPRAPGSGIPGELPPDLGPIACDGCDRIVLPAGPKWFVPMPTLLRIENGVVACQVVGVDEVEVATCLHGG
jgi:hypothetical protein